MSSLSFWIDVLTLTLSFSTLILPPQGPREKKKWNIWFSNKLMLFSLSPQMILFSSHKLIIISFSIICLLERIYLLFFLKVSVWGWKLESDRVTAKDNTQIEGQLKWVGTMLFLSAYCCLLNALKLMPKVFHFFQ